MMNELRKPHSHYDNPYNSIWEKALEKSWRAIELITKRLQERPIRARSSAYIEAYLFCPNINWLESRGKCQYLFTQGLIDFDDRITDQPLFLSQQSAFQYSRFMGDKHAILKVYVPERSIEGRSHKLVLKKGFATHANIQGCYLSKNKRKVFYPNPYFDLSFANGKR